MSAAEMTRDGAMVIDKATEFSGLGRTVLYAMIARGEIASIKIGKRRLIPKSELQRVLAERLVETAK